MNIDWSKRDAHLARGLGVDRTTVVTLRKKLGIPAFRRGPVSKTRADYPGMRDDEWEAWSIRRISLHLGVAWVTARNLKQNRV